MQLWTIPPIIFHSLQKVYKHFDSITTHQTKTWQATKQVFCTILHWIWFISISLYSETKHSSSQLLQAPTTSCAQDASSATGHAGEHHSNFSWYQGWVPHNRLQAAISPTLPPLSVANTSYSRESITPYPFSQSQFKIFLNQKWHHHLCLWVWFFFLFPLEVLVFKLSSWRLKFNLWFITEKEIILCVSSIHYLSL